MDIMVFIIFIAAVVYLIETFAKIVKSFSKGYEEDKSEDKDQKIEKTVCKSCNKSYDIDFPKCPYCNVLNN